MTLITIIIIIEGKPRVLRLCVCVCVCVCVRVCVTTPECIKTHIIMAISNIYDLNNSN